MTDVTTTRWHKSLIEALAGLALGLLTGTAAGLSSSPIATTLVGLAGAAALAAGEIHQARARRDASHGDAAQATLHLKQLCFGIACLASLVGGIMMRTHDTLGLSPKARLTFWEDVGFDKNIGRWLVAAELLPGPAGGTSESAKPPTWGGTLFDITIPNSAGSVLAKLDPTNYKDLESQLTALRGAGSPYVSLVDTLRKIDNNDVRSAVLRSVHDVCASLSTPKLPDVAVH